MYYIIVHFANEVTRVVNEDDIKHVQHVFEFVNENTNPNITLGIENETRL